MANLWEVTFIWTDGRVDVREYLTEALRDKDVTKTLKEHSDEIIAFRPRNLQ